MPTRMTDRAGRLKFPRVRRIALQNFTLYTQQPNIDLSLPEGVVCIAGANGVGKSTYLSAVNYAITARVPSPRRSYTSANEYFEQSLSFTTDFFEGRISERDRETATITVTLRVGHDTFELTRGLFEPSGLRMLRILRDGPNGTKIEFDGSPFTDEERQEQYAQRLATAIGLKSFQQFVFLQHFLLTFDESRRLLFWDPKALDSALFLAFGRDPDQHQLADQYRRQMEREESKGRNTKWQALRVTNRLNELKKVAGSDKKPKDIAALEEDFDALHKAQDDAQGGLERCELRVRDAELKFIDASAGLVALRSAYAKGFSKLVGDPSRAGRHPLVLEATSTRPRCGVCGTEGEAVRKVVASRVHANLCPLCDTPFSPRKRSNDDLKNLKELDEQIVRAQRALDDTSAARERAVRSLATARAKLATVEGELKEFESQNQGAVTWIKGRKDEGDPGLAAEFERLENEVARLTKQSAAEYAERTKWKKKLQKLQDSLQAGYRETEQEFVPMFRQLAERFLGMELDVNVEQRDVHTALVLELRSTARRELHQLSESQRFFLDIALRMALAQFASDKSGPATLFIDTPEGSLDIAYEARAGEMFARFVKQGHDILMTANVNTSQLLKKLAAACGSKRMLLARMTDWGELSAVQLEEEELFASAYAEIEAALHSNDAEGASSEAGAGTGKTREPKRAARGR